MIEKLKTALTFANYRDEDSDLTVLRFKPQKNAASIERLKKASIEHMSIEEKDLYLLDGFFSDEETKELRQLRDRLDLDIPVIAKTEGIGTYEPKSRSMGDSGRWKLVDDPPPPFQAFYHLLGTLAERLKIEVTTHPWLLRGEISSLPAFVVNYHERMSQNDETGDIHCDYEPEKGVCFAIPNLYEKQKLQKINFVNGAVGRPYLVTAMLYSTSENYRPEFGVGTAFYKRSGEKVFSSPCKNMRLVLFEGDILHGVEKSHFSDEVDAWRISYVFKLTMNPTHSHQDIKTDLLNFFCTNDFQLM